MNRAMTVSRSRDHKAPISKPQEGPVAFHFNYIFHRIPGKLYYLALLDSNQQIFAGSKPEFEDFLKSLIVE